MGRGALYTFLWCRPPGLCEARSNRFDPQNAAAGITRAALGTPNDLQPPVWSGFAFREIVLSITNIFSNVGFVFFQQYIVDRGGIRRH
jgi:hypothetical protein